MISGVADLAGSRWRVRRSGSEKQYINSERYFKDQKYWNEIYEKEPQILSFKNDISKINTKAIRYTKTLNKKL